HFTAEYGDKRFLLVRVNLHVVRSVMFGLFAVILMISVLTAWPRPGDAAAEPRMTELVFALFVMLTLLLSPRSRMAYWPVLMIPWVIVLSGVLDRRPSDRAWGVAAFVLGACFVLCSLVEVGVLRDLLIGLWGRLVLWGGLVVLCSLGRQAAGLAGRLA